MIWYHIMTCPGLLSMNSRAFGAVRHLKIVRAATFPYVSGEGDAGNQCKRDRHHQPFHDYAPSRPLTSTQGLRGPECALSSSEPGLDLGPRKPAAKAQFAISAKYAYRHRHPSLSRHPWLQLAFGSFNRRHWQIQASVIQSFYYALESLAQRPSYLAGDRKLCKPCNGRTIGYIRSACRLPRLL